ncbi:ThiF family adenylyltransferase (plasmid) [Streptomyces sp. NBC_00464]|uniref:HesA/MoeB/ThiF family protein n=1 Tax=Streptomyces sp. NBC_00464 TaxID=2975751 RepID=UPI002E187DA3
MARPRVKPEHAPYRLANGGIRLGGVSFGVAAEVKDPTGAVWTLLGSMDGTRSPHEVAARVLELHPEESVDAVRRAVEAFVRSGYVEDAGAAVPEELTDRDLERYSRSLRYFRWMDLTPRATVWEPQLALLRATVTVVGLGGTGGAAAMALAASGVGTLNCVDFDEVELSNLNRQTLYTENDIGRRKVDAAVERLRQLNSDVTVTGSHSRIRTEADVAELATSCDVLLLSADRPSELRDWTNRACVALDTPWVDAGYHGPLVSVGVYRPGEGSCRECVLLEEEEQAARIGMNTIDAKSRSRPVANAVGAAPAGLSGLLAAHGVISLLTGVPQLPSGRVYAINLVALDEPFVNGGTPRPDCSVCGAAA